MFASKTFGSSPSAVWLLSFPSLPMRGLYRDATPLYPCKIAFTVYLCFRNCCDVPLPRLLPDATASLVSKALPYSLLPDAKTHIRAGTHAKSTPLSVFASETLRPSPCLRVPMQNQQPSVSLLAKPLDRPPVNDSGEGRPAPLTNPIEL